MQLHGYGRARAGTFRAAGVTALSLLVAALTWRLRPSLPTPEAPPDTDVVLGCAWLAWALAGYLALAVAAAAVAHLGAASGVVSRSLCHLAPAGLRRMVDAAVTLGLAAAVLGAGASATPAGAMTSAHTASAGSARPARPAGALDWPGLTEPTRPVARLPAHHHPTPEPRPTGRHHSASVGLVSGGRAGPSSPPSTGVVVVQAGDNLWAIAARQLGPGASRAAISTSWHQWYAENRRVVGSNPNLIYPGQRLNPPRSGSTQ